LHARQCLAPFALVSVLDIGRAHAESDASSSVVINEIHYDPRSKAAGEFVELYNVGPGAVNMTGWSLGKGIVEFKKGSSLLRLGEVEMAPVTMAPGLALGGSAE
jgi:hypothetical protein